MEGKHRNYQTRSNNARDPDGISSRAAVKDLNNVNAEQRLTLVNARRSVQTEPVTFNEWLHLQAFRGQEKVISAGGTFFGSPDNPRIVRVNSQLTEIVPSGVVVAAQE
jgi:hypothetical protein